MEAVFAVTPSETIKCASPLTVQQILPLTRLPPLVVLYLTVRDSLDAYGHRTKLIDDAKRPQPRYRGLLHGTACIVQEEGLRGIYRGLFPVVR
jgi:hypothetical protein